jgi:hypothetical protein
VLRDQALNIRFVPDPELWPQSAEPAAASPPPAQPPQDPSPAGGQP